ncbi:hypothetical protein ACGFMO_25870 [Streptomyces niveus]|uniref:hypothetical protein n=1 Tax=Streptomyces niveus TaxID=193462 RepID=UPI00370F8C77
MPDRRWGTLPDEPLEAMHHCGFQFWNETSNTAEHLAAEAAFALSPSTCPVSESHPNSSRTPLSSAVARRPVRARRHRIAARAPDPPAGRVPDRRVRAGMRRAYRPAPRLGPRPRPGLHRPAPHVLLRLLRLGRHRIGRAPHEAHHLNDRAFSM